MNDRTESDLLGEISVPLMALHGAQTQRALRNFPVAASARTLGSYPALVEALLLIKQAAALANSQCGFISKQTSDAIIASAQDLIERREYRHFPIHSLHGGGGTSANMNANEVLANLAAERLGGKRGHYEKVHPNDHVNKNQSTNDVYPTACHMAIVSQWPKLDAAVQTLAKAFHERASALAGRRRIARTCLQDAVDIGFNELFAGYENMLQRNRERIASVVDKLHAVNLGGTIVGRKQDVPEAYLQAIIPALRNVSGDAAYRHAADLFDAAQNPDDMLAVSSTLDLLARNVVKISKDLRLMSSGPETGFGEIRLPPMQPGSSIMPGKINPVIPEFSIQLCFQAIGCNTASQSACDHGELDLNIWESTVVCNVLNSMDLLAEASSALADRCVGGIEANTAQNERNINALMPLLTRLMHQHGYAAVSKLCKEGHGDPEKLRALIKTRGWN